jgi:predicted metal-dependent HD superfamily phosphohydrolase
VDSEGRGLWERWQDIVLPFAKSNELVKRAFEDLKVRYGENDNFDKLSTGRFYHTLHHIQAVLDYIQPFLTQAQHPVALQLAAWFHDVIYDPTRHDNEAKSALYAQQALEKLGFSSAVCLEVERLILLTVGHETAVSDKDGQILIDADLAILAAEPAQYDAYAQAIRREYAHVSDEAYRVGRTQVLKGLGKRPFLYYLPDHQGWEAKACQNIQRELNKLAQVDSGDATK